MLPHPGTSPHPGPGTPGAHQQLLPDSHFHGSAPALPAVIVAPARTEPEMAAAAAMPAATRFTLILRGYVGNVEVVVGDAAVAPLPTDVDGVLFFLVHDLTRLPTVVERAVGAGRVGARVVAFGPVRAAGRLAFPVNGIVRAIARNYVTTFEGFDAPWSHLTAAVPDLRVRRALGGGVHIATGIVGQEAN
jgi:hypothetical protein